jgi:hypothetical protein
MRLIEKIRPRNILRQYGAFSFEISDLRLLLNAFVEHATPHPLARVGTGFGSQRSDDSLSLTRNGIAG